MSYPSSRSNFKVRLKLRARAVVYPFLFSDWGSIRRFARVYHAPETAAATEGATVDVNVRELQGKPVTIRIGSSDAGTVFDSYYHRFHVPPRNLVPATAKLVLDLGANIGCTMAHYARLYPQAKIIGVELDAENAELCRRNIAHWGTRCQVVTGAVWWEDGEIKYEVRHDGHENTMSALSLTTATERAAAIAPAYSLNTLLARYAPPDVPVDFVKMDIEGAEAYVLKHNTEWAARVRCLNIELHGRYTPEQCSADLANLGFTARTGNPKTLITAVKN